MFPEENAENLGVLDQIEFSDTTSEVKSIGGKMGKLYFGNALIWPVQKLNGV